MTCSFHADIEAPGRGLVQNQIAKERTQIAEDEDTRHRQIDEISDSGADSTMCCAYSNVLINSQHALSVEPSLCVQIFDLLLQILTLFLQPNSFHL